MNVRNAKHLLRATTYTLMAVVGCAWASSSDSVAPGATTGPSALDYAFRFATAVEDPQDRAKAQESVVNGYIDAGLLDDAERRAAEIDGWRRGATLGRLAALQTSEGNVDRARMLLAAAERDATDAQGWGRDRILAQVAEVRAWLGDEARAREIAERLIANDPRTYEGRATVALAWAAAANGDVERALRTMRTLDAAVDLYVTWWRTEGYLRLARERALEPEQRAELLDQALVSVAGIDGWKQAEMLQQVAAALDDAGRHEEARACLGRAERILGDQPETMSLLPPLLADLAGTWSRFGERDRALELLARADTDLARVASPVERPAAVARVASGYAALGREADARRLLAKALDEAAGLENPRPRALALAAVARETGRRGVDIDPHLRSRFDDLLAGFVGESRAAL